MAVTHLERLNEKEANKYVIYKAILEKLPQSRNLDELREKLQKENIETLYKYKGQTNELQGVGFRIGEYKYKGSEIDRQFSIKNLERTIQQHRTIPQPNAIKTQLFSPEKKNEVHHEVGRQVQSNGIVDQLTKPERSYEQMPYQWQIKKKQGKKKSRGLHL